MDTDYRIITTYLSNVVRLGHRRRRQQHLSSLKENSNDTYP